LTSPPIYRFKDVVQWPGVLSGIDDVFFQSSNTQHFTTDEARALFRERWLGRYLAHDARWCYVAMDANREVVGYLVASLDDPARTPRFADITYFSVFKDLTQRFPAHLHVNLRAASRSSGTGSALVQRFISEARVAGATGVHVVTSRGARNAGFYVRNGFAELGAAGEGAREIVFLARKL
jgi:GNAT superfamily N-acetyltransferase